MLNFEVDGSRFFRNVATHLPNYTVLVNYMTVAVNLTCTKEVRVESRPGHGIFMSAVSLIPSFSPYYPAIRELVVIICNRVFQ